MMSFSEIIKATNANTSTRIIDKKTAELFKMFERQLARLEDPEYATKALISFIKRELPTEAKHTQQLLEQDALKIKAVLDDGENFINELKKPEIQYSQSTVNLHVTICYSLSVAVTLVLSKAADIPYKKIFPLVSYACNRSEQGGIVAELHLPCTPEKINAVVCGYARINTSKFFPNPETPDTGLEEGKRQKTIDKIGEFVYCCGP